MQRHTFLSLFIIGGFLLQTAFAVAEVVYSNKALELSPANGTAAKINSLDYSPDGKLLVIGLEGRAPEIWNIAERKLVESLDLGKIPADSETNAIWSSDGSALIVSVGNGETTSLFARYDRATKKTTPIQKSFPKRLWRLIKLDGDRSLLVNQTRDGWGEIAIVDAQGKVQTPRDFAKQDLVAGAATKDGSLMAADVRKSVRVFDAAGQEIFNHVRKDAGTGWGLAFSPDGKRLAMVAFKKIEILDLEKKAVTATFPGEYHHPGVFFSPDGKYLILAGPKMLILNAQSGEVVSENGFAAGITAAYAPDGQGIAIARLGEEANIVDCWTMNLPVGKVAAPAKTVAETKPIDSAPGKTGESNQEKYLPGLLMTEYERATAQQVKDGAFVELANLGPPAGNPKVVNSLNWKYTATRNATAVGLLKIETEGEYQFQSINFYDRNAFYIDGQLVCKYRDLEKPKNKIQLKPGYIPITSVGYVEGRGSVQVKWIPPGGTQLVEVPKELLFHQATTDEIKTAEQPPENSPAVAANSPPANATGAAEFKFRQEISFPPEDAVYSVPSNVTVSPDRKLLIANYGHKPLHVWDLQNPQKPSVIPLNLFENGEASFHGSVLWSPDGKKIAVNVSDHGGKGTINSSFGILDVAKKNVLKLPRQAAGIADMAWVGSEGLVISTGSFQDFKLLSSPVAAWKPNFTVPLPGKSVHSVAVTQDGKKIAVAFENFVAIYGPDGKELDKLDLENHGNTWNFAFSPNGKDLAVSLSGELLIYDVEGKKTKQLFRLSSASFGTGGIFKWTPDGTKMILSGAKTQLLSAATGKVLAETPTSTSGGKVALSDDCRVLAHFLDKKKGLIAIWDVSLGAPEKVEQVTAAGPSNEAPAAEVKLEPGARATPEAAFATYRKALVAGDWATLLAVSDEDAQISELMSAFSELGRSAPAEGEELARRKAIFKKYDVRDLTTNAGQRGMSFSFDDVNRIKAIKNRAACLQEVDSLLDPKRHTAKRNFFEKLKVGARTDLPEYSVFDCGTMKFRDEVRPLYFAFVKSGDHWLFSAKAAQRFERDKEQKESNAKLSAEKKQVEVLLDTPEKAVETYRQAMQGQDWKAVMQALCEDSQYGKLRGVIHNAEYTGFSGIDRAEIKAKQQARDEIFKKYGITIGSNKDVSRNDNLKTADQRIAFFSELMTWLVAHQQSNEDGEALAKEQSELDSQAKEGNQTILKYKPVEVQMYDGKKIMRYPTFVALNIDGKWQLDLIAAQKIAYERSKMGDDERAMNSKSGIRLRAILKPEETVPENYYTEVSSLEFSPDGRSLVVGSMNRPVYVYDVAQPNNPLKLPLPKHEGQRLPDVAWSPDGKNIAISVNGNDDHHYFGLYSLAAKRMIKETPARNDRLDNLVWVTADRLAMRDNASPKKWVIVQVPAMKPAGVIEAEESSLFNPFVPSPDQKMIAFALENSLSLHDVSGKEIWKDAESQHRLESLAWSPDSKTLAIGTMYDLTLLNVATHEKRVVAKRSKQPFRGLFYTCDGKKLISVYDGIHVYEPETGKHLLSEGNAFGNAALSPDSKILAVGDSDGNVRLWDLDIGVGEPINPIPVAAAPAVPAIKPEPAQPTPPVKAADKQPPPAPAGVRLWTSADGMFKIEAEFVQQKQGFVQLKRKDNGVLVSIPIAKLSEADQEFLKTQP